MSRSLWHRPGLRRQVGCHVSVTRCKMNGTDSERRSDCAARSTFIRLVARLPSTPPRRVSSRLVFCRGQSVTSRRPRFIATRWAPAASRRGVKWPWRRLDMHEIHLSSRHGKMLEKRAVRRGTTRGGRREYYWRLQCIVVVRHVSTVDSASSSPYTPSLFTENETRYKE